MATQKQIREQLAAACRSVMPEINVYSTARKGPSLPAVVIRKGSPSIAYMQTFNSSGALRNFVVHFMTGQISDKSAQDVVDDLIDPSGSFVWALREAFCDGQWARVDTATSQETTVGTITVAAALLNVQIAA